MGGHPAKVTPGGRGDLGSRRSTGSEHEYTFVQVVPKAGRQRLQPSTGSAVEVGRPSSSVPLARVACAVSLIEAVLLGVLQGLTEFLPISSSGHLRVAPALLGWDDPGAGFTAVVQLGTMTAV